MKLQIRVLLITLLLGIMLNIGFFWFVIQPENEEKNKKEIEYRNLRVEFLEIKNRLNNEKDLQKGFTKIKIDIEKFNTILPRQEDVTKLIQELPKIAEKTDVKVAGVRYQPFIKDEEYTRLSFSLPVEGTYSNIRRFIYEIETMRKIIRIERLALKASYKGRDEVSIQLTMSTYFI